jgi:hypothetical protein
MSRYRVDPAAATSVLHDVRSALDSELDPVVTTLGSVIDSARSATGPKTAAALADIAVNPFEAVIVNVRHRVAHAADSVAAAVRAYEAADDAMATTGRSIG